MRLLCICKYFYWILSSTVISPIYAVVQPPHDTLKTNWTTFFFRNCIFKRCLEFSSDIPSRCWPTYRGGVNAKQWLIGPQPEVIKWKCNTISGYNLFHCNWTCACVLLFWSCRWRFSQSAYLCYFDNFVETAHYIGFGILATSWW